MSKNDLTWWRNALQGKIGPIHDGEPSRGFYRVRSRDRVSWRAVAYWYDGDTLVCALDSQELDEQRAREMWNFALKNPVTHEVYTAVTERGEPWPDEHQGVKAVEAKERGLGDNLAPDGDTFDTIKESITDLVRDANKLVEAGAAKDQASVDQAANLANKLAELQKKADAERKVEKKPHDDAAAGVQAKWTPIINLADVYKQVKAKVIQPFLVAEENKRRAAEVEARRVAEEAAKSGQVAPAPAVERAAPKAAGARRSVALRTVKVVVIEDRDKLLEFFKGHQLITDLLHTMAQRAVSAGVDVPGVKIIEEQRAA